MVQLSFVQDYYEAGFRTFPVHAYNNKKLEEKLRGKKPIFNEWQNVELATPTATVYKNREFGIALDDTHLVIDVDPRNGGEEALKELNKKLKIDLDQLCTYKVLSGRGDNGRHLYFKKPKTKKVTKGLSEYKGLDFLTKGHYVVGAGSKHAATGKEYEATFDSLEPSDLMDAPKELLDLIKKTTSNLPTTESLKEYRNTRVNIQRAIDHINNLPDAIEGEQGDQTTFRVAATCKDYGLSPQKTYQILLKYYNPRCQPPWSDDELQQKIKHAYKYGVNGVGSSTAEAHFSDIQTAIDNPPLSKEDAEAQENELAAWQNEIKYVTVGKGDDKYQIPKSNDIGNAILFMKYMDSLKEVIGYNTFKGLIYMKKPAPWVKMQNEINIEKEWPEGGMPWRDSDTISLSVYLNKAETSKGFDISTTKLSEAIIVAARYLSYHPVIDYLEKLVWDGKPRLDNWLSEYMTVPSTEYVKAVGAKTLLAAVTRVYNPGEKFDHILVLEGEQEIGKSTAIGILGGEWYSDKYVNINNEQDARMSIQGVWLHELGEMSCTTKAETEAIKAFISTSVDEFRRPYGRNIERFPRQCVFIGTSNLDDYLKDETGNRRYWPVACTKTINLKKLRRDRDQIWAEAVYRYKFDPEPLWLDKDNVREESKIVQESRRSKDPWEDVIETFLESFDEPVEFITIKVLFDQALNRAYESASRMEYKRIANCMRVLGWEKIHPRKVTEGGKTVTRRGYAKKS